MRETLTCRSSEGEVDKSCNARLMKLHQPLLRLSQISNLADQTKQQMASGSLSSKSEIEH